MTATKAEGICPRCGHPEDPHILLALDPMQGGIIRCPEEGCDCHATWSPAGSPRPDQETVADLVQHWETERALYMGVR